ncbi:MAG: type II toxin-antitoxin system MqsA family antitoxin [Nitrospinae bacterium]|nr:type II toxin-antitoxin system MqsA family antitoxin [Nitrospinota bacterium]
MYKKGDICPICGEGILSERLITEEFKYKGHILQVPNYHIFICNVCNEELVNRKTLKTTEKLLTDFRRRIDGLFTSDEIRSIRVKLGKTQTEMAALLGVGKKNFARYENGKVTQSKAMDLLLRVLDKDPLMLSKIQEREKTDFEILNAPMQDYKWHGTPIEYRLKAGTYQMERDLAYAA